MNPKANVTLRNIGPHTQLELLHRGNEFLGFGAVSIHGVPVRAGDVPLRPLVETPAGHQFRRLTLRGIRETAGKTTLHLDALGEPGFYAGSSIDYHYDRVPAWSTGCRQATLEIILQPASFEIEGLDYVGFSYQYRLRLRGAKAHQLLDRATWEIGGRAAGNIIVSQSQCCEPEHRCTLGSSFRTWVANKRVTDGRDEYNFLSYCFTPRFSSMQCFDWLDAAPGSLLVFYDRLEHIKGSVFKESGQDVIHHDDLHSFALTDRIEVPAKFVVFHPTRQHDDHAFRNRWTACRDFVFHRYQKQYGIREDYPRTEHHSWLDWERDHVFGYHIYPKNAKRWYYELADTVVPAMKRMGFEKYFDGALLKSLYTENPDCHFPNFTMWDYEISDKFGGMAGLKYLVRKCHQHGIKCELWMDCGLNQTSPILKKHPDWVMRDPHLGPYNGALGFIMGLDLNNDEAFAFIKRRYTRFVREAKIDGIFHDSFPNISGMKINYGDPRRRPHHRRLIELIRYFQRLGLEYAGEGSGPFVLQHGGIGHTDDRAMGEVNYWWFHGREYGLYRTCRSISIDVLLQGHLPNAQYFRFLANQAPLCVSTGHRGLGVANPHGMGSIVKLGDEFARMQKAYNRVRPLMEKRTLLPDEQGVVWRNGRDNHSVVYTQKDVTLRVRGRCRGEELLSGARFNYDETCRLKANGVYVFTGEVFSA